MTKKKTILNDFQKEVLREIGKSDLSKYFYWSGGTALAFVYLKHRLSEDLDFMSEELLTDDYLLILVKKITDCLKIDKVEQQKIYNRHIFIFHKKKQALKLEFVYFPFRNYKKPKALQKFNIKISSVEDIAINKIHALFERAEPKDVFDIYFILKQSKMNLLILFKLVEKKFGVDLDPVFFSSQALRAIDSMEKIQPLLIIQYKKEEMKEYFQTRANKYLKKRIK